jgi:hypothetical protein
LAPVFQVMLENAVRLCGAKFGVLWLAEGDGYRSVALYGAPPALAEARRKEPFIRQFGPHSGVGRAIRTKQVVHIDDYRKDPGYIERDPRVVSLVENGGARDAVFAPLLNEHEVVGARFHLATRPLLAQHQGSTPILADDVERILADIDADHGDFAVESLGHGVLLVFAASRQLGVPAGLEHGRIIPFSDICNRIGNGHQPEYNHLCTDEHVVRLTRARCSSSPR